MSISSLASAGLWHPAWRLSPWHGFVAAGCLHLHLGVWASSLNLASLFLVWHGASAATNALPMVVSISILTSWPVASSLASVPVARPLLVFRDCRWLYPSPAWRLGLWHPAWRLSLWHGFFFKCLKSSAAASSMASRPVARRLCYEQLFFWRLPLPLAVFISILAFGPVASSMNLVSQPVGRPLFLVFRDCCLTPLKSSAAAFSMVSGPIARRLCCKSPTAAAVCLASRLAVCITSTASFSSVPSLLDPPQKFRCSFQHGI